MSPSSANTLSSVPGLSQNQVKELVLASTRDMFDHWYLQLTGYIMPGRTSEVRTSAVASAGEKPDDIQMPMLKPKETLVSRILVGKRSMSQVQKGLERENLSG